MLMSTGMMAYVLYASKNRVLPRDTLGGPVNPEHSEEFLHPFAFSFVQAVEDGAVADFNLAVPLRIISCVEPMGDLILGVEAGHLLAGNVHSVVGDDGLGDPEAIHYVLPQKPDNLLPGDFGERHCLDSFGEVVGGY